MDLFQFHDNSTYTRGFPWAMRLDRWKKILGPDCPGCGSATSLRYEGEAFAYLENGTKWSDVIGVGDVGPPFLLSKNVIDTFTREGITGFDVQPVVIAECKSKRLRDIPTPEYYYINVTGKIDIDLQASRVEMVDPCPVCFRSKKRSIPFRIFPIEESWDGSDIFAMRNYSCRMVFCSRKVFELAHEYKWTNFYFEPMDAIRRHTTSWKGIDYRGRKWPPKEWYPPAPSDGKSFEEWVEVFRENIYQAARCHDALLDFEDAAIPCMVRFLHNGTDIQRHGAARVLYRLRYDCGIFLPIGIEDILRKELPDLYKYK